MPVDPMTGAPLPYDDEMLEQEAMLGMLDDPMMGGATPGMVSIEVPEWAVPAVMEFVAVLEQESAGAGMDPMMGGMDPMGGGMDPMMGDPMMGGMPM
jgi:hypothetical protein